MQWQAAYAGKESYWNAAKAYYAAHGNLDVPAGYKSAGGLDLHAWVDKQWQMYHRPTENNADKRQQLEKIGMTWECAGRWHLDQHEKAWHDTYLAVRQYWQANGSLPRERDKTKKSMRPPTGSGTPRIAGRSLFYCYYAFGNVTLMVVPLPTWLCRSMRAWCSRAICLTMASPRPVPPVALLRLLSTR